MARRGKLLERQLRDHEERPIRWRKYQYLILIVCEDEKTEPYYFREFVKAFPKETVFLREVGTGRSSVGVVERAIDERRQLAEDSRKDVDETWAIFDKDDAQLVPANAARFVGAFTLASEENIKVAYSNEVFELWVLLHFTGVSVYNPIPREEIYAQLQANVRALPGYETFTYDHHEAETEVIDILRRVGSESAAITRAETMDEYHHAQGHQPIDANPNTTVYTLVRHLRELIAYYQ